MKRTLKAELTRERLVDSAASILREEGSHAVTFRKVAMRAEVSPSSPNYYFDSIAELLREAGFLNIALWAQRAENAAERAERLSPEECRESLVGLVLEACLPHDSEGLSNHYAQLLAAAESSEASDAYREGRLRLDAAVQRILTAAGSALSPGTVIALVDGAAVAAISEGRSVIETAAALLRRALTVREGFDCKGAAQRTAQSS